MGSYRGIGTCRALGFQKCEAHLGGNQNHKHGNRLASTENDIVITVYRIDSGNKPMHE